MTSISQLIAVQKGVGSKFERTQTDLHRMVQVPALVSGILRTYEPKDDDGDRLPPETTKVQLSVEDVLKNLATAAERFYDVTLTKEAANTQASADVVVDDNPVLRDVPVTYLLFLEKQLVNLATFVAKLPVLDPAQNWTRDETSGVFKANPVQTVRSKKVPKNWVKYEATQQHPAQVETFHEDIMVGTWTKVDTSGAIPATRKQELLDRVDKLSQAVKFARERANSTDVTDHKAAEAVFGYLFA